jgi:hypothetical protein
MLEQGAGMTSGGFGDQPEPGQQFGREQFGREQFGREQFGQGQFGQGQSGPGQSGQQPGWPPPPSGPTGPYVQVGAGWPQLAGRRTNSLAIAALCCAIGQFIAGPFAGIAAIVLGTISLKQIRVSGEDGRGMAITGVVLGIVGTIVALLVIVLALAIFHTATAGINNINN